MITDPGSPPAAGALAVGLLGPLTVTTDTQPRAVPGGRLRALLTRLAVEPGRSVGTLALVEAVWGEVDEAPSDPTNALQSLVSRLRRAFGVAEVVRQTPTGYLLAAAPDQVDAFRFTRLVEQASDADPQQAYETLGLALELWRGEPLEDAGDAPYAEALRVRWEEDRLVAEVRRLDLGVGLGQAAVGRLEELARTYPQREDVTAVLLRALGRSGRTAEALQRYEDLRRRLADELGADPGPELQSIHLDLLRGEPTEPPPPPAASPARDTLPRSLTSFVGREQDVDRLLGLLDSSRLVSVVGPGGAGKTRLAIEVGRQWQHRTGRPVWLVELAPVTDPESIASELLSAIGLRDNRLLDQSERSLSESLDRLVEALQGLDCVLVIDNCEHLVDPVARLVDRLLARTDDVRVLTTTREPLGLTGERLSPIATLTLPPIDCRAEDAESYAALRLFRDRAVAAQPDFVLDAGTVAAATEIVRRLDGMPLAIELAAARLRVLPVAEVAARLSDRFRLLTGGSRTSLPRHRTLRAVVDWSWDLLDVDERLLAERVAVVPGGVDVAAATAICGGGALAGAEIEELLTSLVDKSLLQPAPGPVSVRFRMLETIREYGVERLADRGELATIRKAHSRYFIAYTARIEPDLRGRDQLNALALLDSERDNISAALRYLLDSGDARGALGFCLALSWYWTLTGTFEEATNWLAAIMAGIEDTSDPDVLYAEATLLLASFARPDTHREWSDLRGELSDLCERLLAAPLPRFPGLQAMRMMLPLMAGRDDLSKQAMDEGQGSADPWVRAATWATMANYAENVGDRELMRRSVDEAEPEFRRIGDRWGMASVLIMSAQLAVDDGDLASARSAFEEALTYVTVLGSAEDALFIHLRLGDLSLRAHDVDGARVHLRALRDEAGTVGIREERLRFADVLEINLLNRSGDADGARTAAGRLRRSLGADRRSPLAGHSRALSLAALGAFAVVDGDLDQAGADVEAAYVAALPTEDMPIIATVGGAYAALRLAEGEAAEAAVLLGASDRLRGGADPTDLDHLDRVAGLRAALGAAFEAAYDEGWSLDKPAALARIDPRRR